MTSRPKSTHPQHHCQESETNERESSSECSTISNHSSCFGRTCQKASEEEDENQLPPIVKRLLDRDDQSSFRECGLEEKCGVFGCISNGDWPTSLDVAQIICLGLVGLQHRGQESAGIVTCKVKNEPFSMARGEGLVSAAFTEISMMGLKGNLGVGHTRYSTSGGSGNLQLAQPFVVHTSYGTIAVSHNGELVNSSNLRQTLLSNGVGLSTGGDSELITQCLSQAPPDEFRHPKVRKLRIRNKASMQVSMKESLADTASFNGDSSGYVKPRSNSETSVDYNPENKRVPQWKTDLTIEEDEISSRVLHLMSITPISYSLIIMYNECLYAVRDSFGNRPLTIGMLVPPPNAADIGNIPFSVIDNTFIEGWVISSESCPFPSVHAKLKRDVEPGEIVKFERNKLPKTLAIMPRPASSPSPAFCIFEYVYFARPDSIVEKQTIYAVRMRCGRRLAIESPTFKEPHMKGEFIVAPVPESSIPAALGFSLESGLPYVEVFCKNRYVGRTFIQPSTRLRRLGVAKKFGPLTENFRGKSIILIDDSIVRGTTIGQLVLLLREAGAKEVHIRIASPPLHFPCYMGINIPTKEELIANHRSPDQLALALGASSLRYLSLEGLKESVQSGIIDHMKQERAYLQQRMAINGPHDVKPTCEDVSEKEITANVGHCTACLTGAYPVQLDEF
ncbi:Amidophosphoribosyltransferase, partial [Fragariocoptes setiger]